MYYAVIILLLLVFPAGAVAVEHILLHSALPLWTLVAKWLVFSAGGLRLGLAALRQIFRPAYTAETIFATTDKAAQHLVQELGFGNAALALISLSSLALAGWRAPAAAACALFYLLAGFKHLSSSQRTPQQDWAMVSDILIGLALAACAAWLLLTKS